MQEGQRQRERKGREAQGETDRQGRLVTWGGNSEMEGSSYIMDPPIHFFSPQTAKDNTELVFYNLKIRLKIIYANQKTYCIKTKKSLKDKNV